MRFIGIGIVLAAAWSAVLLSEPQSASVPSSASAPTTSAASPPKVPTPSGPPTLSETDRLRIVNASQAVEIWTLRLQQAASEVQTARATFDKLVASVTPDGWTLNEKLEFVKVDKDK